MPFRVELRGAAGSEVLDLFHVERDDVLHLNTGEEDFWFRPTTPADKKPGVTAVMWNEEGFTEERDLRVDQEYVFYPAYGSVVASLSAPDRLGNRQVIHGWQFKTGSVVVTGM